MTARLICAALLFSPLLLAGCASYTTPYLDQQSDLNGQWRRGEISKAEYEQRLHRLREGESWSAAEPRSAYHATY